MTATAIAQAEAPPLIAQTLEATNTAINMLFGAMHAAATQAYIPTPEEMELYAIDEQGLSEARRMRADALAALAAKESRKEADVQRLATMRKTMNSESESECLAEVALERVIERYNFTSESEAAIDSANLVEEQWLLRPLRLRGVVEARLAQVSGMHCQILEGMFGADKAGCDLIRAILPHAIRIRNLTTLLNDLRECRSSQNKFATGVEEMWTRLLEGKLQL